MVVSGFDNSPEIAQAYLEESQGGGKDFSWVHLYDSGERRGLDSDLAVGLGILTLPATIVVDQQGKVVKSGIHWTELDSVVEQLVK